MKPFNSEHPSKIGISDLRPKENYLITKACNFADIRWGEKEICSYIIKSISLESGLCNEN